MAPHVRTVPTASKATAVQIVWSSRRGDRDIEHVGSAHSDAEVALLKSAAYRRIAGGGQPELDLGLTDASVTGAETPSGVTITGMRMGPLIQALTSIYTWLGFDEATGSDEVFYQQVIARLVEPTSKQDSLRVIEEIGLDPVSYTTVKRRLPKYASKEFQATLSKAMAARADLGPHALVLFDVSTLFFQTDKADGFREPGFSKERRLEPQITLGLLTDAHGAPLMATAFEGNTAETKTMIPMLEEFMAAHRLTNITVVADAGMVSDANRKAIIESRLNYIIGEKIPSIPYVLGKWIENHPTQAPDNGMILTTPVFEGPAGARRNAITYYQYRDGRARRSLRGIDEQIAKAERAAAGKGPVKRNRFLKIKDEKRAVNRELETKARALAGWKAYITNLLPETASADYVIGAYHQLWHIEQAFRMSKHDLAARPIYAYRRESIDAHLNIVVAALAVAQRLEAITGWSRKRFITTARRYRQATISINGQTITADPEIPQDLEDILTTIAEASNRAH